MSDMLLLECVWCNKRQQIRQGLVQACACGGTDFVCVGPEMPASGAVQQLDGWTTFPGVPGMPPPTRAANIGFDNSAEADRSRAAMNTIAALAQSPKRWLRVERVKQAPFSVGDGYELEIELMNTNGPLQAGHVSVLLSAAHARVIAGRERQLLADKLQSRDDENAKLKVELFDLTRENETLKRKAMVKR